MGASMSAPTPISQDPSDIAYEFLGYSPAAIGPVNKKAAPASHGHAISKSVREIMGFGLAVQFVSQSTEGGYGLGIVSDINIIPDLPKWTIEAWVPPFTGNSTTGGSDVGFGFWNASSSTNPQPTGRVIAGFDAGPGEYAGWTFPDGSNFQPAGWSGIAHVAVSCDGTATRAFLNGVLQVTKPAYTLSSLYGVWGCWCGNNFGPWDEFRVSNVARYTADFTPSDVPFSYDPETLLLWHLDDGPLGEWFNGAAEAATGILAGVAQDSTPAGNDGQLVWHIEANVTDTITSLFSPVTSTSGSAPSQTMVLSLQAQTGDLVLTDTSGNSVATPVPQSDGTTQLQTSLMAFKAAWSSTTAYAVGDTVTSGGLTYVCIANNTNNVPPNATYWAAVGGGGGGTLAHTYEQEITVTTAVTALTYTPTTSGLFRISFYFRVVTAATDVTVTVTTTDATGAQTWDVLPLTSEAVDSYQLDAITVAGTAGHAIDVVVTAGTANQVYFSSSIEAG